MWKISDFYSWSKIPKPASGGSGRGTDRLIEVGGDLETYLFFCNCLFGKLATASVQAVDVGLGGLLGLFWEWAFSFSYSNNVVFIAYTQESLPSCGQLKILEIWWNESSTGFLTCRISKRWQFHLVRSASSIGKITAEFNRITVEGAGAEGLQKIWSMGISGWCPEIFASYRKGRDATLGYNLFISSDKCDQPTYC